MKQSSKEPNLELVQIKGKDVMVLVPEIEGDLALVHFSVLARLAKLLPKANMREIIKNFRNKLYETETSEVITLDAYVAVLEAELAFHKSVNLITRVDKGELKPKAEPEAQLPGVDDAIIIMNEQPEYVIREGFEQAIPSFKMELWKAYDKSFREFSPKFKTWIEGLHSAMLVGEIPAWGEVTEQAPTTTNVVGD